ncbi:MAG: hypothetical protein M0Q38_13945 [Bacteroidales bacterium]|jgi:hypothetical protein|nr:hypothetical protein [Bacteroidales bacterium]
MASATGGLFSKIKGMLADQFYFRQIKGKSYLSVRPKMRKKKMTWETMPEVTPTN